MRKSRLIVTLVLAFLLVFSTACACTDRIANLFGRGASKAPTPAPTVAVTPLVIPKGSYQPFKGEMSAAEIQALLQEQIVKEAGDYVSDIQLQITPEAMLATLQVNATQLNIKFRVTIAGVPNVVNGKVYLQVTQITIDDSLSGWTRLSAKSMIQEMIDQYAGKNGIPIEFDNLYIQEVQLREGKVYIKGQTLP